jgi:hypothetical protein
MAQVADIIVLTEQAVQVATSKKNGPGTLLADQWMFLSEMRGKIGD